VHFHFKEGHNLEILKGKKVSNAKPLKTNVLKGSSLLLRISNELLGWHVTYKRSPRQDIVISLTLQGPQIFKL